MSTRCLKVFGVGATRSPTAKIFTDRTIRRAPDCAVTPKGSICFNRGVISSSYIVRRR